LTPRSTASTHGTSQTGSQSSHVASWLAETGNCVPQDDGPAKDWRNRPETFYTDLTRASDIAISTYAAMVRDRLHFAEATYGDGEWYCMLGRNGRNANGEAYDPGLADLLRMTLLYPHGQWCVFWWPHGGKGQAIREKALEWIEDNQPAVNWIPHRAIARANAGGYAATFYRACRTRRVVLVGGAHLQRLDLFPVAVHVQVPHGTAWKEMDRIEDEVREAHEPDDLVLFASGMASNVMIWRLWQDMKGKATLMDVGSALDPYCGLYNRGTHNSAHWKANVMPRNIP
jgi:hypothetical protein